VILVAFKAIDPTLREPSGGFDSHTPPPQKPFVLAGRRTLHVVSKPSRKGTGFEQPPHAHQHWHIDVSYINIST
jgi:hypothetical protein